jgi:hypothetical protein
MRLHDAINAPAPLIQQGSFINGKSAQVVQTRHDDDE